MWWASSRPWAASRAVAASKPPRGPRKPATPLQRAVRMLARRDMSRAELAARLGAGRRPQDSNDVDQSAACEGAVAPDEAATDAASRPQAATPAEIDAALERLVAIGLQSDTRFAENYVRGRQARTGSRRLAAELRQKGVDGDTIGEALAGLGETDLQRARALWARRFSATRDPRERARQIRFLAARGFDMQVICAVIGGALDDDPPDTQDDAAS